MYWYLSFLRPPPTTALASGTITITPQIANDLRTEIKYGSTDIYYAWQQSSPYIAGPQPYSLLTAFTPPESTYKPVDVPICKEAKIGERWRLGLFVNPSQGKSGWKNILDLMSDEDCEIISVWSGPIEIVRPSEDPNGKVKSVSEGSKSKGKKKDGGDTTKGPGKGKQKDESVKQTRIEREWNTPCGPLRIIEQTSFDLDKKIWDSGLALSSWLYRHFASTPAAAQSPHDSSEGDDMRMLQNALASGGPRYIVELGSGTGLVSIVLKLIYERRGDLSESCIVATDLGSAIDLMEENFAINDYVVHSWRDPNMDKMTVDLQAKVLDWDRPLPKFIGGARWPHMIIAADVTYNTDSFPSLLRTVQSLMRPNDRPDRPPLLLAYKERDPGERRLWEMLEEAGIKMSLVDRVKGAEEEGQVEIWLGVTK